MLKGKTAVITGGSDGIGLGIAEAFVKNHATVCLVGRNQEKLEKAKLFLEQAQGVVHLVAFDLGKPHRVSELAATLEQLVPTVDILVNNAGMGRFIPFEGTDEALLDMHLNLNVKAPYMLTQQLLPRLVKARGSVINISSYFSHRMLPGRTTTAYSMTKGAIDAWTKALAFEVGRQGVRVNAIAPGSVETATFNGNIALLDDAGKNRFSAMVKEIYPLGHLGSPADVGSAAVFLASEHASWITGQILGVDGGLTTN